MKFTIAVAQIDNVLGDLQKNIAKHIDYVRRAKEGGADLVVFPELSLAGYLIKDSNWDLAIRPTDEKLLSSLMKESNDISILLGCVEESADYGIYNSAFFFEKGKVQSVHKKIYLPTYGMFEEMRYFSAGKTVRAFDSCVGRLGVVICEDLWHLPLPYILAQDGAQVIIAIAASPTRLSGDDARTQIAQVNSEQHRAYARLLSSYMVYCNRVGFEDGVNFWGGSEIIGPNGDTIVQAKLFEEQIIFAELDGNDVRRARRFSRHFLDDDIQITLEELGRIKRGRME
jgi:predicted amidohydrolase